MTIEEASEEDCMDKDKLLRVLAEERNDYAKDCNERIAREYGKIEGADYMLHRLLEILKKSEE